MGVIQPSDSLGRVLVAPCEVAGYYAHLTKGLRHRGIDCDFVSYYEHPFRYGSQSKPAFIIRLVQILNSQRLASKWPKLFRLCCGGLAVLLANMWAARAVFKYDTYIICFGTSLSWGLFGNWDLRVIRWRGAKIISHLNHGSEARPPYMNGFFQSPDGKTQPASKFIAKQTKRCFQRVSRIESLSNVVVGAPFSTSHFAKKRFVNTFALGVPFIPPEIENASIPEMDSGPIRILHSPSHPAGKGSNRVRAVIDRLKENGHDVVYVEVVGRPNQEVLEEIALCDFVIDQVFSDFPLAGFATEAAWFGKPAVVGGYGLDQLRKITDPELWPPSQICHPDNLYGAVEALVTNQALRENLGSKAKEFVTLNWNRVDFADRYCKLLLNEIPEDWFFDPQSMIYTHGIGQTEEQTMLVLSRLVEEFGSGALKLDHRLELRDAFINRIAREK